MIETFQNGQHVVGRCFLQNCQPGFNVILPKLLSKICVIDVGFFRDDLSRHPVMDSSTTSLPVDLDGRVVLLVDDVLFTGRTIRAALNALAEWGRPRAIQLAVMVDRGHRELPIRPDFVGKNLPTALGEAIRATLEGVWIGTEESA